MSINPKSTVKYSRKFHYQWDRYISTNLPIRLCVSVGTSVDQKMLISAFLSHLGPADYDASLMYVTLLATTNSMTTAELRITIQDEDILERDENFTIMLDTMENRVNIANSTSVIILNDDGEIT